MHHTVERPDGGFRITATDESVFRKLQRQISAVADVSSSHSEVRKYDFVSLASWDGPHLRGILKAALHFVVTIATNRERAREVSHQMADALFVDAVPDNVSVVPYEIGYDVNDIHVHELTAWNQGDETLVRMRIFNLITYLVRLPLITIEPCFYRQNTQNGTRVIRPTLIPRLITTVESATLDGFREEFGRRVDAVVAVGSYKSDVADHLDAATREMPYRMAVGADARRRVLNNELRERMHLRDGLLTSWMAREVASFAERRIEVISS